MAPAIDYSNAAIQCADPVEPCSHGDYMGWFDLFYCIDPKSWAFLGVAVALFFSTVGAAW